MSTVGEQEQIISQEGTMSSWNIYLSFLLAFDLHCITVLDGSTSYLQPGLDVQLDALKKKVRDLHEKAIVSRSPHLTRTVLFLDSLTALIITLLITPIVNQVHQKTSLLPPLDARIIDRATAVNELSRQFESLREDLKARQEPFVYEKSVQVVCCLLLGPRPGSEELALCLQ